MPDCLSKYHVVSATTVAFAVLKELASFSIAYAIGVTRGSQRGHGPPNF